MCTSIQMSLESFDAKINTFFLMRDSLINPWEFKWILERQKLQNPFSCCFSLRVFFYISYLASPASLSSVCTGFSLGLLVHWFIFSARLVYIQCSISLFSVLDRFIFQSGLENVFFGHSLVSPPLRHHMAHGPLPATWLATCPNMPLRQHLAYSSTIFF